MVGLRGVLCTVDNGLGNRQSRSLRLGSTSSSQQCTNLTHLPLLNPIPVSLDTLYKFAWEDDVRQIVEILHCMGHFVLAVSWEWLGWMYTCTRRVQSSEFFIYIMTSLGVPRFPSQMFLQIKI
jgi:hypothetical protein